MTVAPGVCFKPIEAASRSTISSYPGLQRRVSPVPLNQAAGPSALSSILPSLVHKILVFNFHKTDSFIAMKKIKQITEILAN